jgi:TctA family transporter
LSTAFAGLAQILGDPVFMGLIVLAVPIGMIFGVIPGLGGKVAIVLVTPFVLGMDAAAGAVFLLAVHAVVHTGGSIPSILLGIPGSGPDAATVVDGYPLTQRGEAGRALGASLSASAVGGVIGAMVLAALLPVLEPIVLAFSPAEFFLLAILGITFIAALSGDSLLRGLIVGCFGLTLAFVGLNQMTGEPRFTFGELFLWNGVDVVTAVLGLFAVPEIVALAVKGGAISSRKSVHVRYRLAEVIDGMREVFRHRWLTLRTSAIGAGIGIIPGLGGDAASWICYGHAVQSSSSPERFGTGAIEGVIAPETANNAKEGGSLLPTLFFGVPGSSGMALLLGAFVILGLDPGPRMIVQHQDLVWTMIWALVLANLLAVPLFLALSPYLAGIANLRASFLVPIVLTLAILGSLLSTGDWRHLILLLLFAILGYGFKSYGWPRPPLVIGLVLGGNAEVSFHQAMGIWGPAFFLRPISLILLGLILLGGLLYVWRRKHRRGGEHAH